MLPINWIDSHRPEYQFVDMDRAGRPFLIRAEPVARYERAKYASWTAGATDSRRCRALPQLRGCRAIEAMVTHSGGPENARTRVGATLGQSSPMPTACRSDRRPGAGQ